MKFGFRIPSFKKRISARTSWKRVARHNLGLKAPRGLGWVTNPKKAAYNRVYNRTTVGLGSFVSGKRGSSGKSAGCGGLAIGLLVVGALSSTAFLQALAWAAGGVTLVVVVWFLHSKRTKARQQLLEDVAREEARAKEQRARELAAATAEEWRRQRQASLEARFGIDIAAAVWKHEYWRGATTEMIIESLGTPVDIREKVYKTKTKTTYCYRPFGSKRYALKIHFEDSIVVGWDEK